MIDSPKDSTTRTVVIVVVAVAAVLLVGGLIFGLAGGGGDSGGAEQTPFVVSGSMADVEIRDLDFSPRDITIDAGATVTWTNNDDPPHDAVSDDDAWETDLLEEGDTGSVTFDEAGSFPYHCSVHPDMEGTISVR